MNDGVSLCVPAMNWEDVQSIPGFWGREWMNSWMDGGIEKQSKEILSDNLHKVTDW